jgi:hypothetical protein
VKVALALVVGFALTALGMLLTTVAEWVRWVLLLPWALLKALVSHPDIGAPGHPFHEGTPLDLPAAVIGLATPALMNIVIAYFVVSRLHRSRNDHS